MSVPLSWQPPQEAFTETQHNPICNLWRPPSNCSYNQPAEDKWKLTHHTWFGVRGRRRMSWSSLSWQQPWRKKNNKSGGEKTDLVSVYLLTLEKWGSRDTRKESRPSYQEQSKELVTIMDTIFFVLMSLYFILVLVVTWDAAFEVCSYHNKLNTLVISLMLSSGTWCSKVW